MLEQDTYGYMELFLWLRMQCEATPAQLHYKSHSQQLTKTIACPNSYWNIIYLFLKTSWLHKGIKNKRYWNINSEGYALSPPNFWFCLIAPEITIIISQHHKGIFIFLWTFRGCRRGIHNNSLEIFLINVKTNNFSSKDVALETENEKQRPIKQTKCPQPLFGTGYTHHKH